AIARILTRPSQITRAVPNDFAYFFRPAPENRQGPHIAPPFRRLLSPRRAPGPTRRFAEAAPNWCKCRMESRRGQDDFARNHALFRKLSDISASRGETLSLDTLFLRKTEYRGRRTEDSNAGVGAGQ